MIEIGYKLIDHQTGGFHKGELISIIGRPLMGRTMFALNLFKNILADKRNKVVFLTSECPAYKLKKLLNQMGEDERQDATDIIKDVTDCRNADALLELIQQLVDGDEVNVVILDSFHYLTLLENVATPFLYERLADIARKIKQLAREFGITIIMTSRTNYLADEREGVWCKCPQLSDTNKIGDLAYYSDVVLGLYRPEVDGVSVDGKGNDMHNVLFVSTLKSRKSIKEQSIKCFISSNNCCIAEQGMVSLIDCF